MESAPPRFTSTRGPKHQLGEERGPVEAPSGHRPDLGERATPGCVVERLERRGHRGRSVASTIAASAGVTAAHPIQCDRMTRGALVRHIECAERVPRQPVPDGSIFRRALEQRRCFRTVRFRYALVPSQRAIKPAAPHRHVAFPGIQGARRVLRYPRAPLRRARLDKTSQVASDEFSRLG